MKTSIVFASFALSLSLYAQQPKTATSTPTPADTVQSLKADLSKAHLEIAQKDAQIHAMQHQIHLYEVATGMAQTMAEDQAAIEKAKAAAATTSAK
jgi:hypothetical protein